MKFKKIYKALFFELEFNKHDQNKCNIGENNCKSYRLLIKRVCLCVEVINTLTH